MTRLRTAVALLAAIILAACAQEAGEGKSSGEKPVADVRFPVTIDTANGPLEIVARPARIVSLSPTATEMLFAIRADEQVVAVDDQSSYPPEAPVTDLSGFEPNVEAIAGQVPDLVVLSGDPGGVISSLEELDIPVLMQPAATTLDDTYDQIEELGQATGETDEATVVVDDIRTRIEEIVASAPIFEIAPTYYHELDDTYFTVTSETFIGQVYGLLGLENIADGTKGSAGGYPQLSAEYIVAEDPDYVFLADTKCCDQDAAAVADRPGWADLSAVRNGGVVELDDDIASRWGPRVVELLEVVSEAIAA